MKKERILNRDNFEILLLRLDVDREQAGEVYEELRRAVILFFESRGSLSSEEQADEVFDRVANNLSNGQKIYEGSLSAYVYGVARNVWREEISKRPRSLIRFEDLPSDGNRHLASEAESSDEYAQQEAQLECLDSCLRALPPEQRKMIIRYYQGDKGIKIKARQELSDELGVPLNALRIRVSRLREKLEVCVRKCLREKSLK